MSKLEFVIDAFGEHSKKFNFQKQNVKTIDLLYSLCKGEEIDESVMDGTGLNNIGTFYQYVKKDIPMATKYYLLASEKGSISASNNLGYMYGELGDTEQMLKYYQISIDMKNVNAMHNLFVYYKNIGDTDNMKKYLMMAFQARSVKILKLIRNLIGTPIWNYTLNETILLAFQYSYSKKALKYLIPVSYWNKELYLNYIDMCETCFHQNHKIVALEKQIKTQEAEITELRFRPGGPGFEEAKSHFDTLAKDQIV